MLVLFECVGAACEKSCGPTTFEKMQPLASSALWKPTSTSALEPMEQEASAHK